MAQPLGFLSYTRKDDQFFGGYITAFREALEAGVQVVTGDRSFRLFQDVEGIVIGEQWQKKLAEVIGRASCFLPILTPLFLTSPNCREEIELFIAREGALGRDDMILPIYLVDSPLLEKAEERERDPVAREIARRQRYDWRENGWLPLEAAGGAQGGADARPGDRGRARAHRGLAARRPWGGPWRRRNSRRADCRGRRRRQVGSPASARCCGSTTAPRTTSSSARRSSSTASASLWPRAPARPRGLLAAGRFDAIISDVGRPDDRKAGLTLLGIVRRAGNAVPYFLYNQCRRRSLARAGRRRSGRHGRPRRARGHGGSGGALGGAGNSVPMSQASDHASRLVLDRRKATMP